MSTRPFLTARGVVAVAAAIAAAGIGAVAASGSDPAGTSTERRLVIALPASSIHTVDVAPKGHSVGDTWQASGSISESGRRAGRAEMTTTLLDRTYQAGLQIGVLALADGTITYQGVGVSKQPPATNLTGDANTYAITGGTGTYAGAGGTLTVHAIRGSRTKAEGVLRFSP